MALEPLGPLEAAFELLVPWEVVFELPGPSAAVFGLLGPLEAVFELLGTSEAAAKLVARLVVASVASESLKKGNRERGSFNFVAIIPAGVLGNNVLQDIEICGRIVILGLCIIFAAILRLFALGILIAAVLGLTSLLIVAAILALLALVVLIAALGLIILLTPENKLSVL